jgi:hypothetical protein
MLGVGLMKVRIEELNMGDDFRKRFIFVTRKCQGYVWYTVMVITL